MNGKKLASWVMMLACAGFSVAASAAGDAAKAAEMAKTVCAACHGAEGNSPAPTFPNLAGQSEDYLLKQLKEFQSGARNNAVMAPMVAALTPEDMQNLAAYFAAQKPAQGAAASNGKGSLGEKIYRAGIAANKVPACAACHGPTGAGLPARFPRLSGQHADYTLAQMKAFDSGERANAPMMKVIAARMSNDEMAAVADYIQGLR